MKKFENEGKTLEELLDCEQHGKVTVKKSFYKGKWYSTGCLLCYEERCREKDNARKQAKEKEEQRRKSELIQINIEKSMIPLRFKKHSFETFKVGTDIHSDARRKRKDACIEYAENFEEVKDLGRCMIFFGNTGTGKTHLACSIANNILQRGYSCVFMTVLDAIREVKESYSRNCDRTEKEVIESFIKHDLLILDELGVQFGSDTERMIIFEIINKRYENLKSTIILSNLEAKDLQNYLGTRVIDRMKENEGKLLNFDWSSHRNN